MDLLLDATNPAQGGFMQSPISSMILLGVMFAVMYFIMIRPQTKQKKAEEEMRKSLGIGDEVVTIGGIIGRIVNVREDSDDIILETGADRNKLRVKRWAVSALNGNNDAKKPESK